MNGQFKEVSSIMMNVGISGLILVMFGLLGLVLTIALVVAIFQIRNATKETAKTLHAIQQMLMEQKKIKRNEVIG